MDFCCHNLENTAMKISIYFRLAIATLFFFHGAFNSIAQQAEPYQDFSKNPRVLTPRYSFWFEGNLNGTLKRDANQKPKWQYQVDYQYRRNSDASYIKDGEHFNIFKDMTASIIRPWIHYWPMAGKLRLSISPVGHWGSWTPKAEEPLSYFHEYRTTLQGTLYSNLGKLEIQQRYRFEFRFIGNKTLANRENDATVTDLFSSSYIPSSGFKTRMRYNVRFNYPLSKSGNTYVSLWDELFLGFGKNTANNKFLDQNRLVGLYGIKFNQDKYPMKLEFGFTWQLQPKYNITIPVTQDYTYGSFQNRNIESNLAFQVYLIFDEFHKFRKNKTTKKKEPTN